MANFLIFFLLLSYILLSYRVNLTHINLTHMKKISFLTNQKKAEKRNHTV